MASASLKTLIIGGGFSGMSAAIELRKRGAQVDLVEIDPHWRSYGAGISIGGATLRALEQIGVLDAFLAEGSTQDGPDMYLADGTLMARLSIPRLTGTNIPGGGAIMRPVLAAILARATRALGTNVKLGTTFTQIVPQESGARVTLSDGTTDDYDLVIGADGLYSSVRQAIFPQAPKPRFVGQAIWRAVLPRPKEVDRTVIFVGENYKAGLNAVSRDQMYLFITENRQSNDRVDPQSFLSQVRKLMSHFSAPLLQQVTATLNESSQIVYRPLETLLLPLPWHTGRVVLIGDAAHATTPHLASGACIGIEDAIVLAEELDRDADVGAACTRFERRRFERCRMVVENSLKILDIEVRHGDPREHGRITSETLAALAQPI